MKTIKHVENITGFCFSDDGLWVSTNNDGVSLFNRENNFSQVKVSFLKNFRVARINKVDDQLLVGMDDGQFIKSEKLILTTTIILQHSKK